MTVKLVVLYTQPEDPEAFDQHYFDVHMPLVRALPGLQRTETGHVVAAADRGERSFYRITGLYFADQAALDAAFGSAEGKATAADYQKIAPAGPRMFITAVDE
jgi:uncharacterized protein (TIGR02118 family)